MKKYLATTGLSDFWDINNELYLLGPWCLNEETYKKLKDKNYVVIPSPFSPTTKIKIAADYCDELFQRLIPQITKNLNMIHNTSFNDKYWKIFIGPWLYFFIGILYDRFKRCELALSIHNDLFTHVLPEKDSFPVCYDSYDFITSKINDHFFNFQIFSLILREIHPTKILEIKIKNNLKFNIRSLSWKSILWRKFNNWLFANGEILLTEMVHLTFLDKILIQMNPKLKNIGFYEFIYKDDVNSEIKLNLFIRNKMNYSGADNKFEAFVNNILPFVIPLGYVELYKKIFEPEKSLRKQKNIKLIGSTFGWYFNDFFKQYAASSSFNGTKLIEFQHGGGYGTLLASPNEKLALQKDFFFTFGWKSIDFPEKTIPGSYYYFAKLKDTHNKKLNKIIFVGEDRPKYPYKLITQHAPEDMGKYFLDKKYFFNCLKSEIRNEMIYRPRMIKPQWETEEVIKSIFHNTPIIREKELIKWMQTLAMVIIDHPHTAIYEALVINVPSLFFWDHTIYLMKPEADEYFKLLRDAEIVHTTPESAAKTLNKIWPDLSSWWQETHRQNIRKKFITKYCNGDTDWKVQWSKTFKDIIKNN